MISLATFGAYLVLFRPVYFFCCWTINLWVKVLLFCMHNLLQATEKSLCLFPAERELNLSNWWYGPSFFKSCWRTLISILTYNVTSEYTYSIVPCNCAHNLWREKLRTKSEPVDPQSSCGWKFLFSRPPYLYFRLIHLISNYRNGDRNLTALRGHTFALN